MPLTYQVSTAPTASIVTLNNVKQHLYIDTNDDDDLLKRLINTAERYVGRWTQRALPTQTIKYYLDYFPTSCGGVIRPPVSPIQSITSIEYTDTDGNPQTLTSPTDYQADLVSEPSRIMPANGASWPSTDCSLNNVIVTFVAGYATLDDMRAQNQALEQAVMILVGEWYENRESAQDVSLTEIPEGLSRLLGLSVVGTEY